MELNFQFMAKYLPMYADAAVLTVKIAFFGIIFAVLTGMLCAAARYYRIPVLKQLSGAYIELSRNTPLLVQLFFLYFGLPKAGVALNAEVCAVCGLAFLGGGYMAETFRGGLESVDGRQIEAAESLGMGKMLIFREIILPEALGAAAAGLCANVIFLIKETSVVSGIALADLMYVARDLIGLYYETEEALLMLVIFYLIILLPISILSYALERRLRHVGLGI